MEKELALEQLLTEWRGRLFAVAYAELPGRYADAQDAVAAAFVRIVQHVGQLQQPERFGAWACQIARREARRIAGRSRTETISETQAIPEEEATLKTLKWDVEAALGRLPSDLALTMSLYYQQGHSVSEIARQLHTPEGTIKWRLSRGRERLREMLKGYEPMKKYTCALIAPHLEPEQRTMLHEALYKVGWTEIRSVGTFEEAAKLITDAVILTENIGEHSAFELIPLLRQHPQCQICLLLNSGRTEQETQLATTAAYILGVDFLLTQPFERADFCQFAQRMLPSRSEKC
jgi:RNA polymerase sigma factor (sigma-70 family)